jgi:hypothetical protein
VAASLGIIAGFFLLFGQFAWAEAYSSALGYNVMMVRVHSYTAEAAPLLLPASFLMIISSILAAATLNQPQASRPPRIKWALGLFVLALVLAFICAVGFIAISVSEDWYWEFDASAISTLGLGVPAVILLGYAYGQASNDAARMPAATFQSPPPFQQYYPQPPQAPPYSQFPMAPQYPMIWPQTPPQAQYPAFQQPPMTQPPAQNYQAPVQQPILYYPQPPPQYPRP